MGSSDVPPASAPAWLVSASTACLGAGVFFWLICYVLMTRRSLATNATPIPLPALALNLAWETVYAFYVTEAAPEIIGFSAWLVLDLPVLYATLKTAPRTFRDQPLIRDNVKTILVLFYAWGLAANAAFAWWWLREPHRGSGLKWGKRWKGVDGKDTTELAWWTAGASQLVMSAGCLGMLLQRGTSDGQSYGIWFTRFVGTQMGLPVCCVLLYWHWPEAHGFVVEPLSYIIVGTSLLCDLAYPFALAHVRSRERRAGTSGLKVKKKGQ